MGRFDVVEASIASLQAALETGAVTSEELVEAYLERIRRFDGPETPTALNSVIVFNPDALEEARESDARRKAGSPLGPLDGIPYTAKDSYLVKGLTAAAGSRPSSICAPAGTPSRSSGCARPGPSASA